MFRMDDPHENMPLFRSGKGEAERKKLEQKLYFAQENPDEVFNLSECALKNVPSGVFSKCRVFRKTTLILHSNKIASLEGGGSLKDLAHVEIFDLHSNNLRTLPEDIGAMTCLKILDVSSNALKTIPISFESLTNLEVLILSTNKLKEFPAAILKLKNLRQLDISNNDIHSLPAHFYMLSKLKSLILDSEKFVFPDAEVCNHGVEAIMRFLCEQCDVEYPVHDKDCDVSDAGLRKQTEENIDDQKFEQFQIRKEQRRLEMLAIESQLQEAQVADSHLAEDSVEKRRQLLLEMAREQNDLHEAFLEIQNQKYAERKKLMSYLEKHAASLIEEISSSISLNTSEKFKEALEADRLEMEQLYSTKYYEMDAAKKQLILDSMVDTLHHNDLQTFQSEQKKHLLGQLQESDLVTTKLLEDTLRVHEKAQQDLAQHIQEAEDYQKAAFETLQLKNDKINNHIIQQIQLIEMELSRLSEAERAKQHLRASSSLDTLSSQRTELAYLLVQLLNNKAEREKQLRQYVKEMERKKNAEMADFWLIQYQTLLDRKPPEVKALEEQLDKRIVNILESADAEHYVTLFASKGVDWSKFISMDRDDFKRLGILSEDIIDALMKVVSTSICSAAGAVSMEVPSAPPQDSLGTPEQIEQLVSFDVKLWHSSECVICFEVKVLLVFLPCGHVCCCRGCGESVSQCPLCRVTVENKLSFI